MKRVHGHTEMSIWGPDSHLPGTDAVTYPTAASQLAAVGENDLSQFHYASSILVHLDWNRSKTFTGKYMSS